MTDKFTQDVADAAAKAHDDEVYAVEQNAQNFEAFGCAIAVLQRTDSRTMPADVRKMIYEVRAKLSLAHSILINEVATPSSSSHKLSDLRVKTPPSLGAQLADLRSIIDKVEAARTRIAQRARSFDEVVDRGVRKDLYFDDILDLLVDARQTAIDMRDEVERTLGGKFLQLRDLKVGDCFRFKDPPPGWTDGKLQVSQGHPSFAMPEGWDFFPIELLDGEIERVDGGATLSVTQASSADPTCRYCGVKLVGRIVGGIATDHDVCGGCE